MATSPKKASANSGGNKAAKQAAGGAEKSDDKFAVKAPQLSLPKGGGALHGIGEKFSANPVTGTGSLSVPIATSPGRGGFGPQLSLSYDSGAGNTAFGLGWNLALPVIARRTDKGLPRYEDSTESDIFVLSGSEDLVPVLIQDANGNWIRQTITRDGYTVHPYRPRIEGLFSRIERWTRISDGDTYWRSISRDNIVTFYGKDTQSRVVDAANPTKIFTWLICESRDDKGNALLYQYIAEDSANVDFSQVSARNRNDATYTTNRYLKRVKYGNTVPTTATTDLSQLSWLFEVVFDYDEGHISDLPSDSDGRQFVNASLTATQSWPVRQDPFSRYRSGFEVRTNRLCRRALMFHHFSNELGTPDYLVRTTEFSYNETPTASFIISVTQSGFVRQDNASYLKRSMPPVEFIYSQAEVQSTVCEVEPDSLANLPAAVDGTLYQWLDLDGEGSPGVLASHDDSWYYKRNLSPLSWQPAQTGTAGQPTISAKFDALVEVATLPGFAQLGGVHHQFLDLAGDGHHDCVIFERPLSGFYKRNGNEGWDNFTTLESVPNIDWNDPNLRFIDLDGDGHADILITENDVFTWYPSLAEQGFDGARRVPKAWDEELGPAIVFADGTQTMFQADMSGDGLTDIVRIRNGEVCYWPNLGYGSFGKKITMNNSPWFDTPDLFDPRRLRLADIDGCGTTDLIYLASDGVRLYFNQAGNGWSTAQALVAFPHIDDMATVQALDLMGNGTACLVWMSSLPGDTRRSMRYVDLMGGQKPHLMIRSINNLGAETRVQYAPSTKFYLADRAAGTPWMTKLPFPVQVVERVESWDVVSRSRFVSRYAYHHGYYDGFEREFRGFGMVEQFDTEELGALSMHSADSPFPTQANIDSVSYVPPVLSKTWFHVGAYPHGPEISRVFMKEYWRESDVGVAGLSDAEFATMQLADTILPAGLSADETREAIRALKGSQLRHEVYALDGSLAAGRPFSISEKNLTIKRIQATGPNRHAVFLTHEREAVDLHYERKLVNVGGRQLADPRTTHNMIVAIDAYGNPLQTISIAYGRRHDDPDPQLTDNDRALQRQLHISYTENSYTNPILEDDAYRTPVPADARNYELIHLKPDGNTTDVTNRFEFDEMIAKLALVSDGQHDLPYEDVNGSGATDSHPYRRLLAQSRTFYRKNDLSAGLPLGRFESKGLAFESYKLAFTPGLLALYQRNGQALLSNPADTLRSQGGYFAGDDLKNAGLFPSTDPAGLWWVAAGHLYYSPTTGDSPQTELDQAQSHFFVPRRYEDALGNVTQTYYDSYDLLLRETVDPLQNRITIGTRNADGNTTNGNDYRVLQPALITNPNGNQAQVAFDGYGLVVGSAVMGKATESLGDSLQGFQADLTQAQIDQFFADPRGPGTAVLLGNATARNVYDIFRYKTFAGAGVIKPAFTAAIGREIHVSDLTPGQVSALQVDLSFSDGFGREIQKKVQAEPGPLTPEGAHVVSRWITSGWTIYNNKGKPVRQYEPFFDDTADFKFGIAVGVSAILFYDPLLRVVATLYPDHSWDKVVFDPWRQENWDANDTVLIDPSTDPTIGPYCQRLPSTDTAPTWYAQRSTGALGAHEQDAAKKAAANANTPNVAFSDSQGRQFLVLAWNRNWSSGAAVDDRPRKLVTLSITGKPLALTDALNRVTMSYTYNLLENTITQIDMDAGERWTLTNAMGMELLHWDNRDHQFRLVYDALHRRTQLFAQTGSAAEVLLEKTVFGEGQPNDVNLNMRTKVFQNFDGAGRITHNGYDFKGNPLSVSRQLLQDYKNEIDWQASPAPVFEPDIFSTATAYDALSRPVTITTADASIYRPTYNAARLLTKIDINLQGAPALTSFVTQIDYNARGFRERITYGNGTSTTAQYDPVTTRLMRFTTTTAVGQSTLQDLSYCYDPVNNITRIQDDADMQNTIYFRNQRVDPSTSYVYDALYQLIEAKGREHLGQNNNQSNAPRPAANDDSFHMNLPQPGDGQAMGNYTESYRYDSVGNIVSMAHVGGSGNWIRGYSYANSNNQLLGTTLPGDATGQFSGRYSYDANGNMLTMPHLPFMLWDHKDQLRATQQQVVNNGVGERTYYVYDDGGQRVRKVTEDQNGRKMRERIYLDGVEIYREFSGGSAVSLERQTLHVMDDKNLIALIETRTAGSDNSPQQLIRYRYSNHSGSATLELDAQAQIISYEEYFPFGSTSYQAVSGQTQTPKRYQFTGKERDDESGLYYHGARYYACWLGRWTSADPLSRSDGANRYAYGLNNPITFVDPTGKWDWPSMPSDETMRKAAIVAAVVVGVAVTVATAGAAGPVVASVAVGLIGEGAVATVATGVVVGAFSGAVGSAASETARSIGVDGKLPTVTQVADSAFQGEVSGAVFGGLGSGVSALRGGATAATAVGATTATATTVKKVVGNAVESGVTSAVGDAIVQKITTGKVDLKKTVVAGLTGAAISVGIQVGPAVHAKVKAGLNGLRTPPAPQRTVVPLATRADYRAASLNPQPNTVYQYNNHEFTTDNLGRGVNTSGRLSLGNGGNRFHDDRLLGFPHHPDALPGDIGFHAGGDQFGFPGGNLNLFPGNTRLNSQSGAYGRFERTVLKPLVAAPGNTVQADFRRVFYQGNTTIRPDEIRVSYSVNNQPPVTTTFLNQ
jgi:RHS repeat-associated protein